MGRDQKIYRQVRPGKIMETEEEVNFIELIREFNHRGIRYLIIGRRAIILYGGPVLTADYDLWVHAADREKTLFFLSEDLGFEISHPPNTKRPIVTGFSGMKKFDLFFHERITNMEDETISFVDCYRNATRIEDEKEDVFFRIPSLDDLIRLKKIRPPNVKDEQDIAYILKAKELLGG